MITPVELVDRWSAGVGLDGDPGPDGVPREPLVLVDLGGAPHPQAPLAAAGALCLVVGVGSADVALHRALDLTVGRASPWSVETDPELLLAAAERAPLASITAARVLRQTGELDVLSALAAESAAYSTLLGGPDHARLHRRRPREPDDGPRVSVERDDEVLRVRLCRPDRRNRVDARLRDDLCDALAVALADRSLRVELSADGTDFSTGGDLTEMGAMPDPATGHVVRLARSAGWLLHRLGARTTAQVQGRCLGSGIELPAFCHRVVARDDLCAVLPELGLGLLPGAGGTVSVARRIGRWRTLAMLLTGLEVDAPRALEWGLVDEVVR